MSKSLLTAAERLEWEQTLDVTIAEIQETLDRWHNQTAEQQAFARLSGNDLSEEYIQQLKDFQNTLRDHQRNGTPQWARVHNPEDPENHSMVSPGIQTQVKNMMSRFRFKKSE